MKKVLQITITETKVFKVSKASKTRQPEAATVQQGAPHRRRKQQGNWWKEEEGFETHEEEGFETRCTQNDQLCLEELKIYKKHIFTTSQSETVSSDQEGSHKI